MVFDDVPGCPKGFRLLLNMFAGTRRNMTLGFPDHLTKWELSDAYREAYLAATQATQLKPLRRLYARRLAELDGGS